MPTPRSHPFLWLLMMGSIFSGSMIGQPSAAPLNVPAVAIDRTQLRKIHSAVIGQDYWIKIQLPPNYDADQRNYPVLYLLDGDHAFAMATDVVQYLTYGKHVPQLIIASPAYGSVLLPNEGGFNQRGRDYTFFPGEGNSATAGGEAYLRFLKEEFIPYIEANFRVDRGDRTLAGFSAGAAFGTVALFREPELFHRYVLIDGFRSDQPDVEKAYFEKYRELRAIVYFAARTPQSDLSRLNALLTSRHYAGLESQYEVLSDRFHFAVPAEGLTRGLKAVFAKKPAAR